MTTTALAPKPERPMNEILLALFRSAAWTIPGNLGSDPEIRFLGSGTAVCNFNLAVNKPGAKKGDGQQPDWYRVEIWGDQAQVAADTLRKGSRCIVTGRVRTEKWTTKDGQERVTTIIRAEEWSGDWNGVTAPALPAAAPAATAPAAAAPAAVAAGATTWQSNSAFNPDEVPF